MQGMTNCTTMILDGAAHDFSIADFPLGEREAVEATIRGWIAGHGDPSR